MRSSWEGLSLPMWSSTWARGPAFLSPGARLSSDGARAPPTPASPASKGRGPGKCSPLLVPLALTARSASRRAAWPRTLPVLERHLSDLCRVEQHHRLGARPAERQVHHLIIHPLCKQPSPSHGRAPNPLRLCQRDNTSTPWPTAHLPPVPIPQARATGTIGTAHSPHRRLRVVPSVTESPTLPAWARQMVSARLSAYAFLSAPCSSGAASCTMLISLAVTSIGVAPAHQRTQPHPAAKLSASGTSFRSVTREGASGPSRPSCSVHTRAPARGNQRSKAVAGPRPWRAGHPFSRPRLRPMRTTERATLPPPNGRQGSDPLGG